MCGIAAIFGRSERDRNDVVLDMLSRIAYRGDADHFGECRVYPLAAMGTNRLAIVDRGHGRQPVASCDGRYEIVFNGEIYNHAALREELRGLGDAFTTDADTEVVVNAYRRWGRRCVERLEGQFAFVIYDTEAWQVFAARDPLGLKPLYWAKSGGELMFASEQKCLVPYADEIRTVPPGHVVMNGHLRPYFSIERPPASTPVEMPVADQARTVRRLLGEAVRKRVDTDLPVAVMFSGGIDSTAVLHLATQAHPDVTAITIGFPGAADIEIARRFCRERGIPHVVHELSPAKALGVLPEVVYGAEFFEGIDAMDACVAWFGYRVAAGLGFKIALCGEGADELLAGYDLFVDHPDPRALMRYRVGNLHRTDVQRVDRAAMLNRVEARVPFLDADFARFAYHVPVDLKLRGGTTKWILREAFRGELPAYITDRPKVRMPDGTGLHRRLFDYAMARGGSVAPRLRQRLGVTSESEAYFLGTYLDAGLPAPRERFRGPGTDWNSDGYFRFVADAG